MKYFIVILLALFPTFLVGQVENPEVKLEVYQNNLIIHSDTTLYNNFKHNTLDTTTPAACGILNLRLTNNSNSMLAFANIKHELSVLNNTNGKSYCFYSFKDLASSVDAEIGYSISDNGENLPYQYYLGGACVQSRYEKKIYDSVMTINFKSNTSSTPERGYIYFTTEDLCNLGLNTTPINSLLILEPGGYFEWDIIYKDCMLFNFEGIDWNKKYDLIITYFQNNNTPLPDLNIENVIPFSGFLLSNTIKVTFKK